MDEQVLIPEVYNLKKMAISENLQKLLAKKYEPQTKVDSSFKRKDITFVTNKEGDPVLLFIGDRKEDGNIKGERYSRVLRKEPGTGKVIKDHWDRKGKV